MGACRTACCEGWPVSLSVADYFKLLGTDCSPELRKKPGCGMHLMDHPILESYAQISAIFRLVEHTDFDRYAAHILKKLDCENYKSIGSLLCIK